MQLGWSLKLKSTQQYSPTLLRVPICGSLHLETSVKSITMTNNVMTVRSIYVSFVHVGGNESARRKPTHEYSAQKSQRWDWKPEPTCCEATVLNSLLKLLCSAATMSPVTNEIWPDFDEDELTIFLPPEFERLWHYWCEISFLLAFSGTLHADYTLNSLIRTTSISRYHYIKFMLQISNIYMSCGK